MLTLLGLLLSKRSIVCSRSGNEWHLMCAHHWIGFTPSVNSDIMGWDVAGGKLEVGRWQNGGRGKASPGSLTIKILKRNSMASAPMVPKDLC